MSATILIVDDDPDFRDAMATLLEAKGYAVDTASDGDEGLAKARKIMPGLILLDVMMSGKTEGFDVAKKLNGEAELKNIPVVMTTGIRKDMNLPFGFEPNENSLPVSAVLEKPVKPEVLLSAVEKYLKKK
jgi:CheY-like chemotaxis protein